MQDDFGVIWKWDGSVIISKSDYSIRPKRPQLLIHGARECEGRPQLIYIQRVFPRRIATVEFVMSLKDNPVWTYPTPFGSDDKGLQPTLAWNDFGGVPNPRLKSRRQYAFKALQFSIGIYGLKTGKLCRKGVNFVHAKEGRLRSCLGTMTRPPRIPFYRSHYFPEARAYTRWFVLHSLHC
jgi:hypothetical protein